MRADALCLSPGLGWTNQAQYIYDDRGRLSQVIDGQAKCATLRPARAGSTARHGSGDFMLAFSTANVIPHYPKEPTYNLIQLADTHLNPLFTATVKATEEAILNALTMATTVVGRDGHRVEAIEPDRLKALVSSARP